ncbi:MAG: hypothetical protein NW223_20095 [Hyphomicrobiaceae bacterium]|nr:hypothetical protein [Hyphomicrobiaceae bacterium]
MKGLIAAAGLVATAGLALALATTSAKAADLYDDPPPPRYSGPAYEDPRYADVYRYPDRYSDKYADRPVYSDKYAERPVPPAPVYRDDDDAFRPGPRHAWRGGECVPRHVIRSRLSSEGWSDFTLGDLYGDQVTVHARRPSGRPYVLTIERCSGTVLDARPSHSAGPYASAPPPPRRWDRPYY